MRAATMLPDAVTRRVLAAHGDAGAAWLADLPRLVSVLADEWALREVGAPFAEAQAGFIAPSRRADGARLVLKVVPCSSTSMTHEARSLAHWAGQGAVRLAAADADRGAILVERAVPGAPLARLCVHDDRAATAAAADVIAQLRSPMGDTHGLPDISSWTSALDSALVDPGARAHGAARTEAFADACRDARRIADELRAERRADVVLHGDLHHHNLLSARRAPWLAADPKGIHGPAEAESAALLRNPRRLVLAHPDRVALATDRVAVLAERLGDDPAHIAGWGYVLAVVAACWAGEDREGDAELRRWLACADAIRVVFRRCAT